MIRSLVLFWFIVATLFASLWLGLHVSAGAKAVLSDVLLSSVGLYLSWSIASWIWIRLPIIPKETIDPSGKAVFITGCDTGFGHNLAKKLADYGFVVYAGCLFTSGQGAAELKKYNKKIRVIHIDVTKDDLVEEARDSVESAILKEKQELWAIVNNAGIMAVTEIEMGDMKPFVSQLEVNTLGLIRVTKAFLQMLRPSKGRVVNVASLAGRFSIPGMVGYCVSKCAVISFSEGLRREMKKWDIDVITIEPHLFNTNLVNNENNHKVLNDAWDKTRCDVKEAYGDVYFQGYKVFLNKVLGSARPRVNHVVETMVTAVTEEFVSPSYYVLNDTEQVRVFAYKFIPPRLLDLMSYYAAIVQTGQPIAKIKQLYDKKRRYVL